MQRIIEVIRQVIRRGARVVARMLNDISGGRLEPNTVTIVGLIMHIPIAWLIASGQHWVLAALLLLFFGLFDTLDGELARLQGRESNHGGFLDASTDRMKEVLLYIGAGYYEAFSSHPGLAAWAVAACGASLCVSYMKAKGEAVVATGKKLPYSVVNKIFADGAVPFEIRMFLLIVGLLVGYLDVALVLIAILATYTAFQRLIRVSRAIK